MTDKNKLNLSKFYTILLLALIAALTIFATAVLYKYNYNKKIVFAQEIPMQITVVNESRIGFNTQTDALYFGIVPMGYGSSVRKFEIINTNNFSVNVDINSYGSELSDWIALNIDEDRLELKNYEKKTIEITANVPQNVSTGNYTAKLSIIMIRK